MAEAKWYVVHTYSGYENKVKANIDKAIENRHLEDQILEVRVPMQDVTEVKDGVRKTSSKKMFPGYVLINMVMNDVTWYVVRNTRGVTGFVGPGSKPVPLTDAEMRPLGIKAENIVVDFGEGDTVAVIGGGLTGCEIAYELALQGKNPIIVEMKDDLISQTGVCLANSSYLREWFALHKTPVYLETTLKEVKDGSIVCTGKDGKDINIDCDSVISCAGYIPAPLAEKSGNVHLVGDCLAIGNLRSVVWRAYDVAMKI